MAKQSFSLHLDSFRDPNYNAYRQGSQYHTKSFFSSRKPLLSNRYSFQDEPIPPKDYRSVSNTHRQFIREREKDKEKEKDYPQRSQYIYQTSRYQKSKKPSIAYIDSQEHHPIDFMSSLDDHIHQLKVENRDSRNKKQRYRERDKFKHNQRQRFILRQRQREIERQRQREKQIQKQNYTYQMMIQPYYQLEQEYKKQKIDNALLAKKIQSKRKDLQSNDKIILQLQYQLSNIIRQAQRLRFQNKQQQAKNNELKEMILRKNQKNRSQQNVRLHYRHSSSIHDLEKQRDEFQQRFVYNNSKFNK